MTFVWEEFRWRDEESAVRLLFVSISLGSLTTATTTATKRLHRHENYHTKNSRHGKLRANAFGRS